MKGSGNGEEPGAGRICSTGFVAGAMFSLRSILAVIVSRNVVSPGIFAYFPCPAEISLFIPSTHPSKK